MTTISKLLVACAAMTVAASQAGAGELLVTGVRAVIATATGRPLSTATGHGAIHVASGRGRTCRRDTTRRSIIPISVLRLQGRWREPRCS